MWVEEECPVCDTKAHMERKSLYELKIRTALKRIRDKRREEKGDW